jgi:hypothetical protein
MNDKTVTPILDAARVGLSKHRRAGESQQGNHRE